ncbi:hypothetical protein [Streptomyces sp. NPDC021356]|uniref:hypothetical protein n=1 Tax=Streptomyces sp. NPDC021356 TaxID=3154900 RepID=UPI0033F7D387
MDGTAPLTISAWCSLTIGVAFADHFGVVFADLSAWCPPGVRQVLDECAMKSTAKSTAIRYSG